MAVKASARIAAAAKPNLLGIRVPAESECRGASAPPAANQSVERYGIGINATICCWRKQALWFWGVQSGLVPSLYVLTDVVTSTPSASSLVFPK